MEGRKGVVQLLCSEAGQVYWGNSFSAVRSSVLEGVSYDGRAQKVQVRPEPVVMLRNYISVLENDQWFKQRVVSLDLLYRKLTLEKSTNGAVRS